MFYTQSCSKNTVIENMLHLKGSSVFCFCHEIVVFWWYSGELQHCSSCSVTWWPLLSRKVELWKVHPQAKIKICLTKQSNWYQCQHKEYKIILSPAKMQQSQHPTILKSTRRKRSKVRSRVQKDPSRKPPLLQQTSSTLSMMFMAWDTSVSPLKSAALSDSELLMVWMP